MTAKQFLDKYPRFQRIVDSVARDAKRLDLSGDQAVKVLRTKVQAEIRKDLPEYTMPKWLAEEMFIA